MAYVGTIGQKITADVTVVGIYKWKDYSFSYYGSTKYIYTMKDADGNIFVWKTGSIMAIEDAKDKVGRSIWYCIKKKDKIQITGTVKDHSVYKDEDQTVLTRVKIKAVIEKTITWEEKVQSRQDEQLATLQGGDFVWTMPYKQYKEHYSDCETIYGSFESKDIRINKPATIAVIIREGRLKASGVRGEHFKGYQMENELGQKCTYRAVCEENALKRVQKDFPDHTWECVRIFQ